MERIAKNLTSPSDGSPLYLGYQSTAVYVPRTAQTVYFHFVFQPPHADGCFQLLLRGTVFKGYIWGTNTHWSPNGRFLVAQWTGPFDSQLSRTLVIIDLITWQWVEAKGFNLMSIDDLGVHGKDIGGNRASMFFSHQTEWNAA